MDETLDIVIIGAGLSGLGAAIQCASSGHRVTVLEAAKELAEIGAGLQLTPNATRLLQKWNIYEKLSPQACEPQTCTIYSYTGTPLFHDAHFATTIRSTYQAPFSDIHRVDLQRGLVSKAVELGVHIELNTRVLKLNTAADQDNGIRSSILTSSGKIYTPDLVVGADGLWSTARSHLLSQPDPPRPTGDLAYRIVLHRSQIRDPELRAIVSNPGLRFWVGPRAHVVAYSMRGGEMFNVVLLVPDDLGEGVAREEGSVEEMRGLFEGWDPVLNGFLGEVSGVSKWKLMHREALDTWISPQSNLVLIGDSCHPMLPYLAQGANSSLEDGYVLGALLAPSNLAKFLSGQKQGKKLADALPTALQIFQTLRKLRGEAIARETFAQRHDFHLEDGEEQGRRDELMMRGLEKGIETAMEEEEGGRLGERKGVYPSRWNCPVTRDWIWGYDAETEVARAVEQWCGENGVLEK